MLKFRAMTLYAAMVPVTAVASLVVMALLVPLQYAFPMAWRTAFLWAIQIVPPFIAGFAIFAKLTSWFVTHRGPAALPNHFARTWLLYAVSALLGALLFESWSSPDLGFYGQLLAVPSCACIGGIFGDIVASVRHAGVAQPTAEMPQRR